jgi:hypothetical protein
MGKDGVVKAAVGCKKLVDNVELSVIPALFEETVHDLLVSCWLRMVRGHEGTLPSMAGNYRPGWRHNAEESTAEVPAGRQDVAPDV